MLPCSFVYYMEQHIIDLNSHSEPPAMLHICRSNSHRNVLEFFIYCSAYTEATKFTSTSYLVSQMHISTGIKNHKKKEATYAHNK